MVTNSQNIIDSIVKEYVQMYGLDLTTAEKFASELSLLNEEKLARAYEKSQKHIIHDQKVMVA